MKKILLKLKNEKSSIIRGIIVILILFAMAKGISFLWKFSVIELIYPIVGASLYIALLYFLIKQTKKVKNFFDAYYNNPDIDKYKDADNLSESTIEMINIYDIDALTFVPTKKLKPKDMFKSMLKYFAIVFTLTAFSFSLIMIALLPVYVVTLYCIFIYLKLWKRQGYSVPALFGMSVAIIIVGILLRPIAIAGAWTVINAFLKIPSYFY